jgi:hypothetical protein
MLTPNGRNAKMKRTATLLSNAGEAAPDEYADAHWPYTDAVDAV